MHNRKLIKVRQEKENINNFEEKIFFKDYQNDFVERVSLINENFEKSLAFGFRGSKLEFSKNVKNVINVNLGKSNKTNIIYDEEFMPFKESSLDLIMSFFNLHFANDVPGILYQTLRSLKPNGLFIASMFCENTLQELNYSFIKAEEEICGGMSPRVSPFAKLQALASLMQEINFSLPVADIDRHSVYYKHPSNLLADLKKLGETNSLLRMNKSFLRKDVLNRMYEIYIDNFSKDGKIVATFEIAWLTGWKYHERQQKPLKRGSGMTNMVEGVKKFE